MRNALVARISKLLKRLLSIWDAGIGARFKVARYALMVLRFKSRFPWPRDVPGTYCRTPSASSVADWALNGNDERTFQMAPIVTPRGISTDPPATRA